MKFLTTILTFAVALAAIIAFASCGDTESPLKIYAALTDPSGQMLATAFQHDTGIYVNIQTSGTEVLMTRVKSEEESGGVLADVLLLADPTAMAELVDQLSNRPFNLPQRLSSFQSAYWSAPFSFNTVIIYHCDSYSDNHCHTNLPIPQSWQDLTSSVYQNQIELANPAYSGTTLGWVRYLSQKSGYGWNYFSALKQSGASIVPSTQTVGDNVAAGYVKFGVTLDSVARSLMLHGKHIGVVWPTDGTVVVPAPVSIVAGHESARSQAFVRWLFDTKKGQVSIAHLYCPTLGTPDLLSPDPATLVSVDWEQLTNDKISLQEQFHTIFPDVQ